MANLFFLSGRAYLDLNGLPYASARLYTYETGTTTNKATYSNAALSSSNTNPVVAGADGVFADIYLSPGRYKFVLKTSADVEVQVWDPVDADTQLIQSSSAPSPTYAFLEYHNTTDGKRYRRDSTNSSWIDLGSVDTPVGGTASVTEQLAGTNTTKAATADSVAGLWQRGTDITPSGGSVSLPSTGGGVFNINAGNFSSISAAQGGRCVVFEFAGASVITHNASSLDLEGNADITTAAGDRIAFVNLAAADASGANWRMLWGTRDDGSYMGVVATQAQQETATNLTFPVTPGRQHHHPSAAKCWGCVTWSAGTPTLQTSFNITSITDTAAGRLTVTIATDFSTANWVPVVTVQGAGGNQFFTQIEAASLAAGSLIFLLENSAGTDTDPGSLHFVGFGDQ